MKYALKELDGDRLNGSRVSLEEAVSFFPKAIKNQLKSNKAKLMQLHDKIGSW